jgi:hypothetical protein
MWLMQRKNSSCGKTLTMTRLSGLTYFPSRSINRRIGHLSGGTVSVGDIGRVLIIIPPFEQDVQENLPAWFTVRGAWCVFELLACILNDCELEMIMTESMCSRLTEVEYTALIESLSQLDCRESEASISEDRERMFGLINHIVGFDQLSTQMKAKAEKLIRQESGAWPAEVTAHCYFITAISL